MGEAAKQVTTSLVAELLRWIQNRRTPLGPGMNSSWTISTRHWMFSKEANFWLLSMMKIEKTKEIWFAPQVCVRRRRWLGWLNTPGTPCHVFQTFNTLSLFMSNIVDTYVYPFRLLVWSNLTYRWCIQITKTDIAPLTESPSITNMVSYLWWSGNTVWAVKFIRDNHRYISSWPGLDLSNAGSLSPVKRSSLERHFQTQRSK